MISKVGSVKTAAAPAAAATAAALPVLTAGERAAFGAAIGIGGFFALLRQAAAFKERENVARYRGLVAAEMARQQEYDAQEAELAMMRNRIAAESRLAMLRRGVYAGDISTTQSASPYVMEAARREAMMNQYRRGGY